MAANKKAVSPVTIIVVASLVLLTWIFLSWRSDNVNNEFNNLSDDSEQLYNQAEQLHDEYQRQ